MIREWIQNIVVFLLLMSLVRHLIPGDSYGKYIRLTTGMILIMVLLMPVTKLLNMEAWIDQKLFQNQMEIISSDVRMSSDLFDTQRRFNENFRQVIGEEIKVYFENEGMKVKFFHMEMNENLEDDGYGEIYSMHVEICPMDVALMEKDQETNIEIQKVKIGYGKKRIDQKSILNIPEEKIKEWKTPLIHHQRYPLLRIVAVHDLAVTGDQFLHPVSIADSVVILLIGELQSAVAGTGVVVQSQAVHAEARILHQGFGPVIVLAVGAAGDLLSLALGVVSTDIGGITAVLIRIELGGHLAAAAPVFVTHAEVFYIPGFFPAVFLPPVCHGRNAVKGHVLDPFTHFLNRAGTHIAGDIGIAAQLAAQFKELMGAEGVVLHHAAPVGIDHLLAVFLGANAILPVVLISKAAAGPAQDRKAHILQGSHHVNAHTVDIGNGGILAHIQTLVNASAQMFAEIAVNILIDSADLLIGIDQILFHNGLLCMKI